MKRALATSSSLTLWFALLVCSSCLWSGCLTDDVDSRFSRGEQLLFENRHEDAESHFLSLARDMGRSNIPGAKSWQAKALFKAGRIDHLYLNDPRRAVARLREAIKLDPEASFAFDARLEVAMIFHDRLRDYRSAALEFERLVHEFPQRKGVDAYQYRAAQSYFLVSDFDQARTEARLLLDKWPKGSFSDESRLLIANSYYLENRFGEAVKAHKELLKSDPDVPIRARSLFELGMCHQDLGDKQEAEKAFLAALKDHPRPDLVQMQLSALRTMMDEQDDKTKPLDYATSGGIVVSQPHPAPVKAPAPSKGTARPSPAPKASESKPKVKAPVKPSPDPGKASNPASGSDTKPKPQPEKKTEAKPAPKPAPKAQPEKAPPPEKKPAPKQPPKDAPDGK